MQWLKSSRVFDSQRIGFYQSQGLTDFHELNGSSFLNKNRQLFGIYRMYDASGRIVYIGHSINLITRVWEHMRKSDGELNGFMLSHASNEQITITRIVVTIFGERTGDFKRDKETKTHLEFVEAFFIGIHKPVLNKRISKVSKDADFYDKVENAFLKFGGEYYV